MKLKDILTTETWNEFDDMDVYNDVTDSVYPAWCGNTFTEEGREYFKEALELEADIRTIWDCPSILVHTDGENWKHNNALVRDLFDAMAGYCTDEEYERWFIDDEEPEPVLTKEEKFKQALDDRDAAIQELKDLYSIKEGRLRINSAGEVIRQDILELNEWYEKEEKAINDAFYFKLGI